MGEGGAALQVVGLVSSIRNCSRARPRSPADIGLVVGGGPAGGRAVGRPFDADDRAAQSLPKPERMRAATKLSTSPSSRPLTMMPARIVMPPSASSIW